MSKIKVALRVRPLSEREVEGGYPVVLAVENNSAFVTDIRVPESPSADSRPRYRQFQFDHGFWLNEQAKEGVAGAATQAEIYEEMGPPLEASVLDGYNACLLAYGQSGTGKTHTMLGSKTDPGLIPRLCHSIWDKLNGEEGEEGQRRKFRMEVSFMEIYREKVRDLLKPGGGHLKIREHPHPQFGPHVQDLSRLEVTQEDGLLDLLWEGEHRRAIGTTGSNHRSSRSHAIWTIYLTRENAGGASTSVNSSGTTITNRVHLVDLAGSEKAGFTTAKNLLAEGADINRSLVALGNVISALAEKAQYIPYRDSALTFLLKDSLGGNATTAIIITASPASSSHAQTLNSFRFAQRARLVENRPRINLSPLALATINGGSASGSGITSRNRASGSATSASALYSIMSAFEIKKDISKLSRIIRSAQTNGGLLRGLAPRASWNRLVNALEGWNAIESEQLNLQRERAASLDATSTTTTTSTPSPSSSSKDGSPKSDAMNQADLPTRSTPTTSNSASNTPTRITTTGNEVFIPLSNSIKCLTWKQEEVRPPPPVKSDPAGGDSGEEYCSVGMTPPSTPPSSSSSSSAKRSHNFHLLLPVQYPVPQHLDHPSRISERIHRSLSALPMADTARLGIVPDVLLDPDQAPLIRQRIPTLVNSTLDPVPPERSLLFAPEQAIPVPILSENEIFFSFSEDEAEHAEHFCEEDDVGLSEFAVPEPQIVPIWDKIEPENEPDLVEMKVDDSPRMRLVPKSIQRRHSLTLQLPPIPSIFSKMLEAKKSCTTDFGDISEGGEMEVEVSDADLELDELRTKLGFVTERVRTWTTPTNSTLASSSENEDEEEVVENGIFEEEAPQSFSSLNPIPSPTWSRCGSEVLEDSSSSSSGSGGSWNFCTPPTIPILVKVIPEEREEKDFRLESITEWVKDVTNSNYPPTKQVSTVLVDILDQDQDSLPPTVIDSEEEMLLEHLDIVLSDDDNPNADTPATSTPPPQANSKFRTHFSQELNQMERIGQQLKKLQQISTQGQRFTLVQPYLERIFHLEGEDHGRPDPKLDAHIEECSGWNVETEMNLVNKEMSALSKLLKIKSDTSNMKQIQGGGRRDSGSGGGSGSQNGNSTLPSSSTTQSPQPPNSPPPPVGHEQGYFRGSGRQMSISETGGGGTFQSLGGNSRNSFSDSVVGRMHSSSGGAFPRYEFQYPHGYGRGEMMEYGQTSSNPFARMSVEFGHQHQMEAPQYALPPHHQYHSRNESVNPHQHKNMYQYSSPSGTGQFDQISSSSSFSMMQDPGDPAESNHSSSSRSKSRPQSANLYGGLEHQHGDSAWRSPNLHQGPSQATDRLYHQHQQESPFSHIFSTPSSSSSTTPSNSRPPLPHYNFSISSPPLPEQYVSPTRPNPMASYNSSHNNVHDRPPPGQQYSNSSINSIFQRRHNF